MAGAVLTPDDLEYEQARKVWNADIDHHPAVIANCSSATDVAEAIRFAQDQGLELAVRSGAHSMPGYSSSETGLVINLGRMNQVSVDPETKRAQVQGGALRPGQSHLRRGPHLRRGDGVADPAGGFDDRQYGIRAGGPCRWKNCAG